MGGLFVPGPPFSCLGPLYEEGAVRTAATAAIGSENRPIRAVELVVSHKAFGRRPDMAHAASRGDHRHERLGCHVHEIALFLTCRQSFAIVSPLQFNALRQSSEFGVTQRVT